MMHKWFDIKREKLSPERLEELRQQVHDRVVEMKRRSVLRGRQEAVERRHEDRAQDVD